MSEPYYQDEHVTLWHGDCLDVLQNLPAGSIDAVVTDPPYGLEFMGRKWDGDAGFLESLSATGRGARVATERAGELTERGSGHSTSAGPYLAAGVDSVRVAGRPFQDWCHAWATECLRVLKPGGHLLAFGGTRTWHRLACAIEDAGFEVRDSIAWLYGSGFSKSWNFKTMYKGEWCSCTTANALPFNHADNTDLPRVRGDVHPSAIARSEGQDGLLLASVQRRREGSGVGEARPQGPSSMEPGDGSPSGRVDDGREEPGVAGRLVHRAGQGLPNGAPTGSPEGEGERLRGRAPASDGGADRADGDAARGGASHQRRPGRQSAGEPEALPGSHESLDDGALRDGAVCPRCGGLDPFYQGAGTGLKPAFEPVVVARKPLAGTVAANVLEHGTGALNIDGCRVGEGGQLKWAKPRDMGYHGGTDSGPVEATTNPAGRWPTNVVLDDSQADELDGQSGVSTSRVGKPRGSDAGDGWGMTATGAEYADAGGASRFFPTFRYEAKASRSERPRVNGTAHPTVKPIDLMRWLVRLVTPPGGTVLEPFAGSGTTVEACIIEGFRCIAIERETDYLPLIEQRIHRRRDPVAAIRLAGDDLGLFELDGEGA